MVKPSACDGLGGGDGPPGGETLKCAPPKVISRSSVSIDVIGVSPGTRGKDTPTSGAPIEVMSVSSGAEGEVLLHLVH